MAVAPQSPRSSLGSVDLGLEKSRQEVATELETFKENYKMVHFSIMRNLWIAIILLSMFSVSTLCLTLVLATGPSPASLPLGTIVAWLPPSSSPPPQGWLPADGSTIPEGPWKGQRTPNLTGRTLVGAPGQQAVPLLERVALLPGSQLEEALEGSLVQEAGPGQESFCLHRPRQEWSKESMICRQGRLYTNRVTVPVEGRGRMVVDRVLVPWIIKCW